MEKSTFEERETWLRVTLLRRTVQFSGYWCDQCKKKKHLAVCIGSSERCQLNHLRNEEVVGK